MSFLLDAGSQGDFENIEKLSENSFDICFRFNSVSVDHFVFFRGSEPLFRGGKIKGST